MLLIIINIVLLEVILSVDNAAALATMVKHLPEGERKKALRYGMFGAYVFRGIALFLVSWLIKISFLKILGGLYLLYLSISFFIKKEDNEGEKESKSLSFWKTVIVVEIMDMAFSIDNIFAVVAMTPDFTAIIIGVIIGITAMRYASGVFSDLLVKYPELEKYAFIIIGMLGAKLVLGIESHTASFITSGITFLLFSYPFLSKYVQNYRNHSRSSSHE